MRVVFWGSPAFARTILDALLASRHPVVGAVTMPARPRGRGRRPAATPVAERAARADLPIRAPPRPRGAGFLADLAELGADVHVVAAYGGILPPEVLDLPRHGALNVHASLLPRYRGAAPVTRAILDGRAETGITIMRMDAGLDTGPICLQAVESIHASDTAGTLTARLADLGGRLAVEALDRLAEARLDETLQDDARASYAPKVTTAEAELDWSRPAAELERAARAYDPWPGAWTTWRGERLKVFRLAPVTGVASLGPGALALADGDVLVGAGDGVLRLARVQPAGGRRQDGAQWARGRDVTSGECLGEAGS